MIADPIAQRAYIAGLIDGEGSIGIRRRMPTAANKMASPKYSVSVSISMTDKGPIDFVAGFCGSPELVGSRVRKDGYKTIFEFAVENDRAAALLREIQPYLVGKAHQAAIALEFAALRKEGRSHRTRVVSTHVFKGGRSAGVAYQARGLSQEYLDRCDSLYQSLLKGSPRSGQPGRFGSRP